MISRDEFAREILVLWTVDAPEGRVRAYGDGTGADVECRMWLSDLYFFRCSPQHPRSICENSPNTDTRRVSTSRCDASGTGGSTESGLEQALEQASYDSDEELEAIRDSVRSLRAQRAAVEKLKEKARAEEGTAKMLRRKLEEAERRIEELRAQGGRDVVRRLMDEVCAATDGVVPSARMIVLPQTC